MTVNNSDAARASGHKTVAAPPKPADAKRSVLPAAATDRQPPTTSERIAAWVAEIDEWLDSGVSDRYQREPLAQHWARVAKVNEEAGEAIEALIAWTGQNPRKPQRDEAREELLGELADVALTAILGMQHFVKDADETLVILWTRLAFLHRRMKAKQQPCVVSAR